MTGLEQFQQGKGDDKAHSSPLKASQSQVHRAEGSADDLLAQGRCCNLSCQRAGAATRVEHIVYPNPLRTIGQHDPSRMVPAGKGLTEPL